MKQLVRRPLAWPLIALILGGNALSVPAALPVFGQGLPKADVEFLRGMTRDVVEASRVKSGSNGGGRWPLTNSCGFALVTPGKDTYTAFWPRDFSMAVDSGFHHYPGTAQPSAADLQSAEWSRCAETANGLHVPAWAIPDHVNYDGAQPITQAPTPRVRIRAPEPVAASRRSTTITNSSISPTPAGR